MIATPQSQHVEQQSVGQLMSPMQMAMHCSNTWRPAPHFAVMDREFRRHVQGHSGADILVMCCPPRHGKTEFLSKWCMAWYHNTYTYHRTILASYNASLANSNGRWVRDTVHRTAPYFGHKGINPMVRSVNEWQMENGLGGMRTAGVKVGITGFGADLIVVDDYLKDIAAAVSEKERNSQWDWFTNVLLTRLQPTGKVVVLATPWHEDDLIGRLRAQRNELGFKIRTIRMQAIYEDATKPDAIGRAVGEALWPAQWPIDELQKRKQALAPEWWQALYQVTPSAGGLNEFPPEYFDGLLCRDDEWPDRFLLSAMALDPSQGRESRKGDYSAIAFAGYSGGCLWCDVDMDRRPVPRMMEDLVRFEQRYLPRMLAIESNAWQSLLGESYYQACSRMGWEFREPIDLLNTDPKWTRIRRLGIWLRDGRLRIRNTTGGRMLIQQLKDFPNGKHDDGPDALEQAIRILGIASQVD